MATPTATFHQGQELSRGELDIFLLDTNNQRVQAAEIYYAIFDVTTGVDVLIGAPQRTPINPEVGEYYAAILVPDAANLGLYRIRWFFKEFINGPQNIVVQEFEVQTPGQGTFPNSQYSQKISSLISSLRTLLRDNFPDRNYHLKVYVNY